MSLDRPWALALLAVPVLLLWLRLRAARPREAEASSLLVWSKVSPSDTLPAKPRPPLAAWIEALGAALIALGLAGPRGAGEGPEQKTRILLDHSASMHAKGPDGKSRLDAYFALYPADRVREEMAGAARYDEKDPAVAVPSMLRSEKERDQDRRIVLVTDHRWSQFPDDPPYLRTIGLGAPCFNAGITTASGVPLPDGRWRLFLTVEAFGAPGPVEGTLSLGKDASKITVQPGRPLEVVREVPSGASEARVTFKGDALPEDDSVLLWTAGGHAVSGHLEGVPENSPLVAALQAAGAKFPPRGAPEELKGPWSGGIHLLGDSVSVAVSWKSSDSGTFVKGEGVCTTGDGLMKDVHVDPSSTLGRRVGTCPTGPILKVLMVDQDGPLATVFTMVSHISVQHEDTVVHLGFVPGGTWVERDPSFVVFAKNLVEYAAGGPARIEATGLLDAKETREAAEGETFGDIKAAFEEAARPDPSSRASFAFPLLLAGALLLGSAWIAGRF